MNKNQSQRIHRIPPCPAYDFAGTEIWLTEMAEKGWFLAEDGFFCGIATFERGQPQTVKYRLEATQTMQNLWSDHNGEPDREQVELFEQYSWKYIAKREHFYIFRSLDPSAREPNTDPEVHALALNSVKKRQWIAVILSIFLLVVYPLAATRGCPLWAAVSVGARWAAVWILFAALVLFGEIRAFISLKRTQISLSSEGVIFQNTLTRRRVFAFFAQKTAKFIAIVALIGTILPMWMNSVTGDDKLPLADYRGEIPFATIADFAGEGYSDYTMTMTGLTPDFNAIEKRSDLLAPCNIDYVEHANVKTADGYTIDGGLYVNYYELQGENTARLLVKELYRYDKINHNIDEILSLDLPADRVVAFIDRIHFPTVIIQKGNIVVRAYFYQTTEFYSVPIEDWAEILCERISHKN